MTSPRALKIGTRGSPLALVQANDVRRLLAEAWPELAGPDGIEIVPIRTSGDKIQDRRLADAGGKGLFTKEIEEALLAGTVDVAVHSMKDVETRLAPGLAIPCLLPREDPRDVLIAPKARSIAELPQGAVVGTASLRRQAQLLALRPDLQITMLRGNVETRLRKMAEGVADATLLALAGLKRLNIADRASCILEPAEMLPAVAQGAIGVECRAHDSRVRELLAKLHDATTGFAVTAERAALETLDGSCRTPIGGLARVSGQTLSLDVLLASADGKRVWRTQRSGSVSDAQHLGHDAGLELRGKAGAGFFAEAGQG
jgi:hydroxymethylbilane synthase